MPIVFGVADLTPPISNTTAELPTLRVEWRRRSAPRPGLAGRPEKHEYPRQSRIHLGITAATLRNKVLRDDRSSGEGPGRAARNVLGEALEICSIKPMTGFYRDGCCNTGREDIGSHTVCVVMTSAFLAFSKSRGNDLSTPLPELGFPGLKPGDRWCLCAARWQEALDANQAPRVVLRATHDSALVHCSLGDLKRFALDLA
jgi:uncharacterized protein (DUF2237 family)